MLFEDHVIHEVSPNKDFFKKTKLFLGMMPKYVLSHIYLDIEEKE